jgi:hypothetical protein
MWLWSKYLSGWEDIQPSERSRRYCKGTWNRGALATLIWLFYCCLTLSSTVVHSFTTRIVLRHVKKLDDGSYGSNLGNLCMSDSGNYFHDDEFPQDDEGCEVLEDLNWRVVKLRLEEENTKRFLKSKPRYLPYDECRKWVSAWNRWSSEKEWYESYMFHFGLFSM